MIAGIIGILKAGAAYVPVDPDYPSERISFMLKDTGASVILSSSEVRSKVSGIENLEIIETDGHNSEIDKQPVNNLTEKAKPHFLAYVLYTSGSTGNPKGVRMPGSGLVNLLNWQNKQFTNKQRRVLQFTSLNFDVSFQEIFSTLCYGSTLCLISEGRRRDMSEVMKDIAKNKITHLFVPYIVLKNLAEFNSTGSEDLNSLEEIITAGEQLKLTKDIDAFLNKGNIKLVNQYGPTEAHVVSSYKIDGNSDQTPLPPIGKPIDNTQLYILRNGEEPVPVGVTGELHIAGVQLAHGYLNLPDLTKEKFIKDPFRSASDARMYRTGDLARWMSDGNIEYMGRTDDQIKIRGYRVELGEIESVLQQNETVKQAVVLAREDKAGNKRLTGYIVTGEQFVKDDLISYMRNRLPEYMIPGLWVEMESLPITPNGKIDKKALPDPDVSELLTNEYTAPRNEDEAKLANIWMEVLDLERVGINDNFFELGGHSLLAMRVISSIRKELGSELAIKDIFQSPTIAELAVLLRTNRKVSLLPGIEAEPRPKLIPMSYSQERLWFIDRLEGSVQYHMPFVLRLKGKLNKEVLAKALRQIVNRHEVLRTVIRQEEGVGYQFVIDAEGWELNYTDGSVYKDDENGTERYIQHLINIPFDLSDDFMMRADLIKITDDDHILTVTMHHIASDGSSISVITREIADLYRSYSENRKSGLLPLPIQYIDYAIWQRKHLQGEVFDKKLNYWKQKLQDTGQLQLPVDFPRPAIQSLKGAVAGFMLDKELSEKIKILSQKHGATLFMTLLTAYKVLLYRYSGQQDICVGIPIAGRQSKEMEALIGFFVNTLAIRNEVNGQDSFTELLKQVKATAMDAFENQEVPFEKVVDAVVGDRDMSKNPLVQVSFALQNTPEVKPESLGELILTDTKFEHTTAKFDLTLFIRETPAGIEGLFEYSTDLFREETIDQMISHFKELINSIVKDPGQSIETMPMLSEAEKWQQLYGFNDTFFAYPKNKSLIDLFEEQAAKTPDNVAVVFEKQSLTYKELNERSNQLAHYLNSKGVKEETLVPICIERGMDMITGILGILKSGAAYVPIDPEYPEERIKFILEDTGAEIIVSSLRSSDKLPASGEFEVILSDENLSLINEQPKVNLRSDIKPDNLAYIIYTSGSTGQPKGVMIEHGPVVNLIAAQTKYFNIKEDERILQFSNNSFDASVEQIFLALFNGASLILFSDGLQLNTALFEKFIHEQKITHLHSTPSFLENIQSVNYEYLKRVIAGGEICKPGLAEYWKNKTSFYNEYGPTETTVTAVEYLYQTNIPEKSLTVPIGKPLSNIQAYILDKNKSPVPDGIEGELYLAGDCLARGYLNSPELTAEKFIKNIFSDKDKDKKDPRMYRTGDLCRRLPDGNIEYLRRLDDQVKIRGYRIELGEIESVMNKLDAVNTCCVILKPGAGNKLVSYYVPNLRELKVKERELYRQQIEGWKEIHDTELLQTEEAEGIDEEFNIIGWNDSFTGEQIEAAQMKEWLEDITEVILSEKPSRVLEIGNGTGLIYYQLAEKIQKYIGTDFSRSSVNQITQRISRGLRNYCPTELKVCAAHEITLSEEENVDTIILNSVVQYFPGEEYMNEVIGKSISLLKGNGRIIAGDVRDNRLLELFKGRLHIEKLAHSASVKEFKWAMEQEVLKEEELCFSPGYFYQLQTLYPQITHIEIKWKQASYINELSLYRFTAVIYVGQEKETLKPDWTDWDKIPDKQSIKNELKKGCEILALMNVPNPRLFKERLLSNALKDKSISNAGDLLDYMGRDDKESTEVNGILNFAKSKNYHYTLFTNEDPLRINLLIEKNTSDRSDRFVQQPFNQSSSISNVANTNIPLFNDISLHLKKEIRSMLQQSLPGYMIPSDMIALKQLPLTVNGKADRKFLMQREDLLVSNKLNYQAPETETEKMLVNIWQELLGADRIGIHDNFFELGGHSLLGMRVISAIRKKLEAELAIKDLFLYPTIAELSLRLDTQSRGSLLPAIEVLPRPELIPLSFSQERLWFIDRLEGSVQYHVPAVLRLKGKLNAEALANSLQSIINRHEVLRTVIIESEGKGYQVVNDKDRWNLQITDGSRFKDDREELQNYIEQLINTPFDLSRDHMIRCDLINISEQEHLLVITMIILLQTAGRHQSL
ncbi:MAG: amino acid adenylation domain-containing protein [Ignavibacteria bacterium]|nr:amino acid adenylation domain-containing protein [Ignavibacteria bacterium]